MEQVRTNWTHALAYVLVGAMLMLLGGSVGMALGAAYSQQSVLPFLLPVLIHSGIAFFIGRKVPVGYAVIAAVIAWAALIIPGLKPVAQEGSLLSLTRGLFPMVTIQLLLVALSAHIGRVTKRRRT